MRLVKLLVFLFILFSLGSCKKWLQVQPEDSSTDEQMYSSAAAIGDVMNGIYLQMADDRIYGRNLTLDKLDLFAQRYYELTAVDAYYYYYSSRSYTTSSVKSNIAGIWSKMYTTIGNVNLFITNLDKYGARHVDATTLRQYYGAAYGLRAFMHFDLLRLFGPVYSSVTTSKLAIPYYTSYDGQTQNILTAEEVIGKIQADLDSAESYLANDPILTSNSIANLNNYRFNYYAVKALEARVYQWIGDKEKALAAARTVIEAQDKFAWITLSKLTNSDNPDRKFFSETIFNVFNSSLYDTHDKIFSSDLSSSLILATGEENQVDKIFEGNMADYRYVYSWPYPTSGSVSFRTFVKYKDISDADSDSSYHARFAIPLMRTSEMYYIAAECETDMNSALDYLNKVRHNRGLASDVSDYSLLGSELAKEYQKEFYGEGQLWYYYKRTGATSIASPNVTSGKAAVALTEYVLPIPDAESTGR
ncbi:SusD family protein [Filimonas lacunae]|uniref:SusD family protein n=1 Tax=Filimonas lacunae TaxID=477680 RepID=A0A173MC18_9BACT|nr:RagB/SusD family nutrient uptake outer membrane protein [Filimonas lacunae]BAV05001.1 hypothetical protein FLA_1006 [Filimonas lacunae]SIT33673.1 SusD family protein [Filimonas lacunae]